MGASADGLQHSSPSHSDAVASSQRARVGGDGQGVTCQAHRAKPGYGLGTQIRNGLNIPSAFLKR